METPRQPLLIDIKRWVPARTDDVEESARGAGCVPPAIHVAAVHGDMNFFNVEGEWEKQLNINFKGKTPLHAAAQGGNGDIMQLIVSKTSNINDPDSQGNTALQIASWCGHVETVDTLIKAKADIEYSHPQTKMTALHYATSAGHDKVVELLLGSNDTISPTFVNAVDKDERTALHLACLSTDLNIIRLLIRKKANMDLLDQWGKSPVDIVYENNQFDILSIMTNNGADIAKLYDEAWNDKLRKKMEESCDGKNVDSYGFYPRDDMSPNGPPRNIKQKHIKKWRKIVSQRPDQIPKKRSIRIIKRIYKDRLPDDLRSEFWRFCLQLNEEAVTTEYNDLIKRKLPHEESIQIDKDINRTIRSHQFYKNRYGDGQCKLFRVLKAYALYNAETRYTQGMSTIAAIILIYLPEEQLAYGAMKELFTRYGLHEWYANGLDGLQKVVFPTIEKLIQKYLPSLHKHLERILGVGMGVEHYSGLFITNWFLELFFESLPWTLMLKVWDTFLWFGTPALYNVALALLEALEGQLLHLNDLTQIVKLLKNTGSFGGDQKKFLKRAYHFAIDTSELERIRANSE